MVCTPIRGTVKLWLLWPPTQPNLFHFYSSQDQSEHLNTGNFKRFGREFEGQIMVTDDKTSPYIPPGWPHMEYTLVAGFKLYLH